MHRHFPSPDRSSPLFFDDASIDAHPRLGFGVASRLARHSAISAHGFGSSGLSRGSGFDATTPPPRSTSASTPPLLALVLASMPPPLLAPLLASTPALLALVLASMPPPLLAPLLASTPPLLALVLASMPPPLLAPLLASTPPLLALVLASMPPPLLAPLLLASTPALLALVLASMPPPPLLAPLLAFTPPLLAPALASTPPLLALVLLVGLIMASIVVALQYSTINTLTMLVTPPISTIGVPPDSIFPGSTPLDYLLIPFLLALLSLTTDYMTLVVARQLSTTKTLIVLVVTLRILMPGVLKDSTFPGSTPLG
jgi:hypothetical protein